MKRQQFFRLMEKALSAYSRPHICRYFDDVRQNGLTEHGFPRLTVNIGILIANGYRKDLADLFPEMMDFCCREIPRRKAANDFSVREIVLCIEEIERSGAFPAERIACWKNEIASIDPYETYSIYAKTPEDPVRNWALFSGVSEYFRLSAGLKGDEAFVETQIASQLKWLDENGMYMDNAKAETHQPMVYDLMPRLLFSLLLARGYKGPYYEVIDKALKKAGPATLMMQSALGEIPFGGRSNQFVHNEPMMAGVLAFEAARHRRLGDLTTAAFFSKAAKKALLVTEAWLSKEPLSHVKNRYPWEAHYGCEDYAYFDKYMITAASNLYAASLLTEEDQELPDVAPKNTAWQTSYHFHKVFLSAGGYSLEFDMNADSGYDASGLGRIHRENAPSAIAMSLPCPASPRYRVDVPPMPLAFSSGVREPEGLVFTSFGTASIRLTALTADETEAYASFESVFPSGKKVCAAYTVDASGVRVDVTGSETVAYQLPAFLFDGEKETVLTSDERSYTVGYEGWQFKVISDAPLTMQKEIAPNRNGHYGQFTGEADRALHFRFVITPENVKGGCCGKN